MKENSIEEDIILLKDFTEGNFKRDKLENYKGSYKMGYFYYKDIQQAIEHLLSDYKKLQKKFKQIDHECERLEEKEVELIKENEELNDINIAYAEYLVKILNEYKKESVSKQKVKDKIEELNKEIKSCTEIDAIFKIKQQQILQELLESE